MSTPAFSHQFSQRWIATPTPVKAVILQELEDIATLLHPDTDLVAFNFHTPHLHEKIDSIMHAENERLERIRAEEAEKARLEAEQLEKIRLEKEAHALEEKRQAEREQAEHERAEQERQLALEKAKHEKATQENQQLKQGVMADLIKQMEDYIQLSLQETAEKLRAELRPWLEAEVEKQMQERFTHKPN